MLLLLFHDSGGGPPPTPIDIDGIVRVRGLYTRRVRIQYGRSVRSMHRYRVRRV